MANPTWFFGLHKGLLGDTVINAGNFSIFSVDFSAVMEGKVQIEGIGSPVSAINGLEISVYNSFYSSSDSVPILKVILPMVNAVAQSTSFSLLSGSYYFSVKNLDSLHTVTINASQNTLSWPS